MKKTKIVWIIGVPLVIATLLLLRYLFWPEFPFYQRPFSECDPNKIITLINNNFNIKIPENFKSARVAETFTSWLECNYLYLLRFTTGREGWEEFRTSFPKVDEHEASYN